MAPILYFPDRLRLLDDIEDDRRRPRPSMLVRCKCRRILAKLDHLHGRGLIMTGVLPPPRVKNGVRRIGQPTSSPRQHVAFDFFEPSTVSDGPWPDIYNEVNRWQCHPRCGASWTVTTAQLVEAFRKAVMADRAELVFDDDLWA